MAIPWDGTTRYDTLTARAADARRSLADASAQHDWREMLEILCEQPELVNTSRPCGSSFYTPLHQAAEGGASPAVVDRLLALGAWRTARNAAGERPCDIAERQRRKGLLEMLEPRFKHQVPAASLHCMQRHLHTVIRGRAQRLIDEHELRLPNLEPMMELEQAEMWFGVPGMYGGFTYRLDGDGADVRLVCESWSRVAGGSGQRHEVTPTGSRLVMEVYV